MRVRQNKRLLRSIAGGKLGKTGKSALARDKFFDGGFVFSAARAFRYGSDHDYSPLFYISKCDDIFPFRALLRIGKNRGKRIDGRRFVYRRRNVDLARIDKIDRTLLRIRIDKRGFERNFFLENLISGKEGFLDDVGRLIGFTSGSFLNLNSTDLPGYIFLALFINT